MIRSERSRIETRQKCVKERFLGYHYDGQGLTKKGAKYEAAFGAIVHNALAFALTNPKDAQHDPFWSFPFRVKIKEAVLTHLGEPEGSHTCTEQIALLRFLVEGWIKQRLPYILKEFEVMEVETEMHVVLLPEKYLPTPLANTMQPVHLPLRMDCLLRRKSDGLLFILDFKTTGRASEDWNVNLDNSLQSHLYITGAEEIYGEPVAGIFYEGLVKGYREMDKAKSSPFNGQVIQYGSPLYGWVKDGIIGEYKPGAQRAFLPTKYVDFRGFINSVPNLREWFPSTIPWRPLDIPKQVASVIVNENVFHHNLSTYNSIHVGDPNKEMYENVLFEQSLGNCFKYGARHPCQFVEICHNKLSPDAYSSVYDKREDHHPEPK
jgi:hypothetical protein